ncbi:MAG: hypothetical protein WCF94_00825 [bacterium]
MTKRNLILIIVIVVLAFIGYKFFAGSSAAPTNNTLTVEAGAKQQIGSDILEKLNALQGINLDKNIGFFGTKAFRSLKEETGEKVTVQTVGRINPFAALEGIGTAPTVPNKTN